MRHHMSLLQPPIQVSNNQLFIISVNIRYKYSVADIVIVYVSTVQTRANPNRYPNPVLCKCIYDLMAEGKVIMIDAQTLTDTIDCKQMQNHSPNTPSLSTERDISDAWFVCEERKCVYPVCAWIAPWHTLSWLGRSDKTDSRPDSQLGDTGGQNLCCHRCRLHSTEIQVRTSDRSRAGCACVWWRPIAITPRFREALPIRSDVISIKFVGLWTNRLWPGVCRRWVVHRLYRVPAVSG